MVPFLGFGHPNHEVSQMPRWVLMFLAKNPLQVVHFFPPSELISPCSFGGSCELHLLA